MTSKHKHPVCPIADLPPGHRKILNIADKSIGVFNVAGTLIAVLNVCPHELAPVCVGSLTGITSGHPGAIQYQRDGQILRCPWHGWEFDLLTGQCLVDKRKLKQFEVQVEAGIIYIQVGVAPS